MFPTAPAAQKPDDVDLSLLYTVAYSSPNDPFTLAEELSRLPEVQYAEPWFIYPLAERTSLPNDSLYGQQWALQKVNAPAAWDITKGDSTIVIAIVDSGVEWAHPDLASNIWINPGESGLDSLGHDKRTNGIDDDGNGYIDDWHGWDLVGAQYQAYDAGTTKGDNDPSPTASNNDHGTHVAGIVAAVTDNHIGVASLAHKCRVLPIKCTADNDTRGGGDAYILAGYRGIAYAAMMGAKIINCSWGANGGAQSEQDIIDFATQQGSLVVAAAGNESSDAFFSPASYRHVLSIAATDNNDTRAYFSNFGDNVDVSAPGVAIYSTLFPGKYEMLSGTSMASPLAAALAALVKSKFPAYTNLQVGEQVRVTSDDISAMNIPYAGRLGRGRINALQALTVKNLPSVRLQSFSVNDSPGGNGNGYAEPGETVNIYCTVKNYLEPTSLGAVVTLTTDSPYLTIIQGSMNTPSLGTFDTLNNQSTPFRVSVLQNVPQSYKARFKLTLRDGSWSDSQFITFLINPTFATQNINNIQLTLANNGRLAYLDYPVNNYGVGFVFNGINHLYEGGLILGTSESRVVNVVRNESTQDEDFRSGDFFMLHTPGIVSDQDGFTRFSDSTAPTANRIGVRVALHSYAYSNPVDSKYIILAYEITNTTTVPLTNFRAGIFLDWDIGPTEAELKQNTSRYDSTRSLGYAYSSMPQGRREYLGIRALDSATSFRSLVNNSLDLSRAAKWDWLSGGFDASTAGPADIHQVISSGPYTVAPGATRRLAFALLAGDSSLANLQQSADAAKAKWRRLTVGIADGLPSVPLAYQLMQNYPNPFNPTTAISYQVSAVSSVSLKVFDVLGREVAVLVDDVRQPGVYTVRWDASSFPSGVYFYRLEAGDFRATRKLMLVK
jgi:subtilisin family serine protease